MAAFSVINPFAIITDDDGTPLEDGYVYIGTANLDPVSNPLQAYWDQALSIPAAQPIRTINGYFSQIGSPGKLYVNATDYSILIKNKNGVIVHQSLVNSNISSTVASTSVTGQFDADRIDFLQTGIGAVSRTVENKFFDHISVRDFGAAGDGIQDDTVEIQAAIDSITAGAVYLPAGTYLISTTLEMRTTSVKLYGDGPNATIIIADSGFSGGEMLDLQDPSHCIVENLQLDCDSNVNVSVQIIDGSHIDINNVLAKNCSDVGYAVRNVDNCTFSLCGCNAPANSSWHFLASAALDATSSAVDGLRCRLIDCYSIATGIISAISSTQSDTSSIDITVERFKEVSNSNTCSVLTNSVKVDHVVTLIDCLFLQNIDADCVVAKPTSVIRTGGVSITGANTPVISLSNILTGYNYSGLLVVTASPNEFSDTAFSKSAVYVLLVNRRSSTSGNLVLISSDGQVAGAAVDDPSFTWTQDQTNFHLEATPIGSTSGTFYFYITQLGDIVMDLV